MRISSNGRVYELHTEPQLLAFLKALALGGSALHTWNWQALPAKTAR